MLPKDPNYPSCPIVPGWLQRQWYWRILPNPSLHDRIHPWLVRRRRTICRRVHPRAAYERLHAHIHRRTSWNWARQKIGTHGLVANLRFGPGIRRWTTTGLDTDLPTHHHDRVSRFRRTHAIQRRVQKLRRSENWEIRGCREPSESVFSERLCNLDSDNVHAMEFWRRVGWLFFAFVVIIRHHLCHLLSEVELTAGSWYSTQFWKDARTGALAVYVAYYRHIFTLYNCITASREFEDLS